MILEACLPRTRKLHRHRERAGNELRHASVQYDSLHLQSRVMLPVCTPGFIDHWNCACHKEQLGKRQAPGRLRALGQRESATHECRHASMRCILSVA